MTAFTVRKKRVILELCVLAETGADTNMWHFQGTWLLYTKQRVWTCFYLSEHASAWYGLVGARKCSQGVHSDLPFRAQAWSRFVLNIDILMGRDADLPCILISRTGHLPCPFINFFNVVQSSLHTQRQRAWQHKSKEMEIGSIPVIPSDKSDHIHVWLHYSCYVKAASLFFGYCVWILKGPSHQIIFA